EVRYVLPEEMQRGSVVGNVAADLGLKVSELDARRARVVAEGSRQLCQLDTASGSLLISQRVDREELCAQAPVCVLQYQLLIEDPLQAFSIVLDITDINDNSPTFAAGEIQLDLVESTVLGSRFPLESAHDPDLGTNSVREYKLSPSDHFALEINTQINGNAYPELVLKKALDREAQAEHVLKINGIDGGSPARTGTSSIHVRVLDANDNVPVFSQRVYKAFVMENSDTGTVITRLNATDLDEGVYGEISYSFSRLSEKMGGVFEIDPLTGEVRVAGLIDYEETSTHELDVQAKDGGGQASHCKLIIDVMDVNDNKPVIEIKSASANVAEDATPGTMVALVNVYDLDTGSSGRITCTIPDDVPFKFLSEVKNYYMLVTDEPLDREFQSEYNITITASDAGSPPLASVKILTIVVSDINDNPPTFAQKEYDASILENQPVGTFVMNIKAVDLDGGSNAKILYHLSMDSNSETSSFLTINSETGALYTSRLFDYEQSVHFQMKVTAYDGGSPQLSSTCALNVFIKDQNDNAPVVLYPVQTSGFVAEDMVPFEAPRGYLVTKVVAVDADSGHNAWLTYRVIKATRPNLFTVGMHTGEIRTVLYPVQTGGSMVAEMVPRSADVGYLVTKVVAVDVDSGQNAWLSYKLQKATDRALFEVGLQNGEIRTVRQVSDKDAVKQRLSVIVEDNGQPSRSATVVVNVAVADSFPEEMKKGSVIGNIAQDLGLDLKRLRSGRARIVTGENIQYTELKTDKGILVVNERIDREKLCGDVTPCSFSIEVILENPIELHRITVEVLDINDHAPVFPNKDKPVQFEISESAAIGVQFPLQSADDMDVGQSALQNYILSPNENFILKQQTNPDGSKYVEMVLQKPLDRERHPHLSLKLIAVDGGTPQRSGTVNIDVSVLDANDNIPVFNQDIYKSSVIENTSKGTSVMTVSATDADSGSYGLITYSLSKMKGGAAEIFTIDERTGTISVSGPIDYEKDRKYEVRVEAKDQGGLIGTSKILIDVIDVNDNPPVINLMSFSSTMSEDAPPGTTIAVFNVKDIDSDKNGQIKCSLNRKLPFKIESSLTNYYSLISDQYFDRESVPEYNITVTATDSGSPPLSASKMLHLVISDVNDNAPIFERQRYSAYITENNSPGASIFALTARDSDWNQNARISYILEETQVSGSPISSYLSLNSESGVISAARSFDYEQIKELQIVVKAQDGGSPPLSSNVSVRILIQDQNDNPPQVLYPVQTGGSMVAEMVPRSADVGYLVTKVVAVDVDSGQNAWLSYKLQKATDRALFEVGLQNGEIRTVRQVSDKDAVKQRLSVIVEDNGQPSRSATVVVNVAVADSFPEVLSEFTDFAQDKEYNDNLTFYLVLALAVVSFLFITCLVVIVSVKIYRWRQSRILYHSSLPVIPYYPPRYSDTLGTGTLQHVYNYEVCRTTDSRKSDCKLGRAASQNVLIMEPSSTGTMQRIQSDKSILDEPDSPLEHDMQLTIGESAAPGARQVSDKDAVKQRLSVIVEDNGQPSRSATVVVNVAVADSFPEVLSEFTDFAQDKEYNDNLTFYLVLALAVVSFLFITCLVVIVSVKIYSGHIRYSVPEEMRKGSLIGNVAQDLGLDMKRLRSGRARVVPGENTQYTELKTDKGILVVNERIDREQLCGDVTPCSFSFEVILENPMELHQITVEITDVNDHSPTFKTDKIDFEISESANVGARFSLISAEDRDVGMNGLKEYVMSDNAYFSLKQNSNADGKKYAEMVLQKPLDRESDPRLSLKVIAVDGGAPQRSATVDVHVTVLDGNDNAPVFNQSVYKATVMENSPADTYVTTVNASDADSGANSVIKYSFSDRSHGSGNLFMIDEKSGVIVIKGSVDYEKDKKHELRIDAKDQGGLTDSCKVIIEVTDVNDNAPTITVMSFSSSVSEDSPPGTTIGIINVKDLDSGDNGQVNCRIEQNTPFKIKSNLKTYYTLVTDALLDRESVSDYNITVIASDAGTPALSTKKNFNIKISDVNDNAPVFPQAVYSAYVVENNSPGVSVLTLRAKDPDENQNARISYILEDTDIGASPISEYISVNAESGVIHAVKSFDYEQIKQLVFMVRAQDGGSPPLSSNVSVRILIQDQNDNPPQVLYPVQTGGSMVAEMVPRSADVGYLVTKVVAVDVDSGQNAWLSYKLQKATDRALFEVGLQNGEIRTVRQVSDKDAVKQRLSVIVEDNGQPSRSATVIVNVAVADSFPEVLSEFTDFAQDKEYNDNLTFYLVLALAVVSFLFITCLVVIVSVKIYRWRQSRILYHSSLPVIPYYPPRYSDTLGTGTLQHVYNYEVCRTTDSRKSDCKLGRAASQNVLIMEPSSTGTMQRIQSDKSILDEPDSPLESALGQVSYAIPEEMNKGSVVGHIAHDLGLDIKRLKAGKARVYTEMSTEYIGLNKDRGVLLIQERIDREALCADTTPCALHFQLILENPMEFFRVTVEITDINDGSTATVKILIQDQNDNPPQVLYPVQTGGSMVAEMVPRSADVGYLVTKVVAVDVDSGQNAWLSYKLQKATDRALFEVGLQNGEIRTVRQVSDKDAVKQRLSVIVEDNGQPSRSATVIVNVAVADSFPEVLSEFTDFAQDKEYNDNLTFYLVLALAVVSFLFITCLVVIVSVKIYRWRQSRILYHSSLPVIPYYPPRYSDTLGTGTLQHVYNYEVCRTTDSRKSDMKCSQPLILVAGQARYSVPEEQAEGFVVGNIARDLGVDVSRLVTGKARILAKGGRQFVDLNKDKGTLVIKERIDREQLCGKTTPCSFSFEVILENPIQLYRVTVEVTDVNDNSPSFPKNEINLKIVESVATGTRFSLVRGNDPDVGVNDIQKYTLKPSDHFKLEVHSQPDGEKYIEMVLQNALDREKQETHTLVLIGSDGGEPHRSGTVRIHITVLDANDNAPVCSQPVYRAEIRENSPGGTVVTTVKATDADTGLNGEVSYSIAYVAIEASNLFAINSQTGEIKAVGKLDFEKSKTYQLNVQASDHGGYTDTCKVIIQIIDENDNVPAIQMMSFSHSLSEDSPPGTTVAVVNVDDADSERNGVVKCSINTDVPFKMESSLTGYYSIVTEAFLDRESVSEYNITITVSDQGSPPLSSTKHINVKVSDVNDSPPKFDQAEYSKAVPENNSPGLSVFAVSATDADWGQNARLSYFLEEKEINGIAVSSLVSVNSENGVIHALKSFDYEQIKWFEFNVTARDAGSPPLSSTATVKILIQDQNDNPPQVLYPVQTGGSMVAEMVPRSADVGYLVTKVVAVDVDSGQNAWLSYKLQKATDRALFEVGLQNGEIRTVRQVSDKDAVKQRLSVIVEDNGQPSRSATVIVNVAVADSFPEVLSEFTDFAQDKEYNDNLTFYLVLALAVVSFLFITCLVVIVSVKIYRWRQSRILYHSSLPVIPYYPPRYSDTLGTGTLQHVYNYE
ncbi:unnamed protein product, partial [Tetraodon nigroviridis]